jgi:uroporphyrinogen-III decarboxylase
MEPVESALQRSIATMMDWSVEQNAQWADYFRLVNTNRAVQHIQQGKISPWMLLGCNAGKKLLKSFNDEQLQMIAKYISLEFWTQKIKSAPADHLFVQETAKEAKIE